MALVPALRGENQLRAARAGVAAVVRIERALSHGITTGLSQSCCQAQGEDGPVGVFRIEEARSWLLMRLPMSLLLAHRAICCVACVLLLPCCSDDMVSPSGPGALAGAGGAAGNAGSPSVSGGAAAAGTGSGAVAGASGGGTNTGYVDCSSFKDSTGWSLRVHIENEMSQTLYLGQDTNGCAAPLFQVEDGARRELPMLDGCRTSCEALTQGTAPPCQEACTSPATVTLEPGQSVEVPWDGRFGVEESLPLQCAAAGTAAPLTCVRAERVEAGVFTFSARAGTRRECLEASGNCGCTPAQSGCTTPSSLIGGTIYTRELLMMLEPGEPSPSGEPPYIGLVFQDE